MKEEEQELPLWKQEQQQRSFESIRSAQNKEVLIENYSSILNDKKSNAIQKRYASDMMLVLNNDPLRSEINEYWNQRDIQNEIYNNKIEYLHKVVDHLRDLVLKTASPEYSISQKFQIARKIKDNSYINDVCVNC